MKKVTIQQIADRVGMSKFAVSQALSGKPGVSEENREKIIQTATMLGYFSQRHIRMRQRPSMRTEGARKPGEGKNTVIVLVQNVRFQNRESKFWGPIIDGVTANLEANGIGVMMVTESHTDHFLQIINPNGVLGLIGIGHISNRMLLEISNAGIPFVLVDHEDTLLPSDTIFMNNFDCMRKVVTHLAGIGHRQMQFIGNHRYSRSFYDRWLGFRSALSELGLPLPEEDKYADYSDGRDEYDVISYQVERMIVENRVPSALVCANDFWAHRVIEVLLEHGVPVPEAVSVTGFDNMDEYALVRPSLTTVDVPKEVMGGRAVDALFRRLGGGNRPFEKTLIYGEVLIRGSVKPRL